MGVSPPPYRNSFQSIPRLRGNSDRRKAIYYECGTDRDGKTGQDLLYVDILPTGNPDLVDFVGFRFYPSRETHNIHKRKTVQLSDGNWVKRFLLKKSDVIHWSKKVTVFVSGKGGTSRSWRVNAKPGVVDRQRSLKLYEPRNLRLNYRYVPSRNFGVEIETSLDRTTTPNDVARAIYRQTHVPVLDETDEYRRGTEDYSKWRLVPDASTVCPISEPDCNKFELVSRILNGEDGLRECNSVVNALNNIGKTRCNKSMGLHVHVSVQGLGLESLKNICLNFVKHEFAIDSIMPPSRESSEFCQSNRWVVPGTTDGEKHSAIVNCKSLTALCELLNPADNPNQARYYKLNLQNLLGSGRKASKPTIEFRQHSSTTNASKIEAWVRFCTRIVDNCRGRPQKLKHYEDAFESLFDTVIEDIRLKAFYRNRRTELQRQRQLLHEEQRLPRDQFCGGHTNTTPETPCRACRKGQSCENHHFRGDAPLWT